MRMKRLMPSLALCVGAFALTAAQKRVVIAPCDCTGMTGEARWPAKTDAQPAPLVTTAIPRVTPADICALPAPSESVTGARIPAEQKWYALVCRIDKMMLEKDGDLHIEVVNTDGRPGRVVVELPCGETWCEMRKHVIEWTRANSVLQRGKLKPVSPHNVTVFGKAFYDTDHAKKGTNQRNGSDAAAWEIPPVMKVIDGDAKLGSGLYPIPGTAEILRL